MIRMLLHLLAVVVPLLNGPVLGTPFIKRLSNTTTLATVQTQPFFIPTYATSAGGFSTAARGWNSFGLQANPSTYKTAGFDFNDYHLAQQCDLMVLTSGFDYYCSIDSGWSLNGGDQYGRIVPDNANIFTWYKSLAGFADHAHSQGYKVGIYLLPGAFVGDGGTTIENTTIKIGDVLDTSVTYNLRQAFKWGADGVQQWHDSVICNLASMGVDMIKLDYLTPGSPSSGENLPADTSQSVANYRQAIKNCGATMRLDISWGLDRDEPEWDVWKANADTLRLDTDVNNDGKSTFTSFDAVQRVIEAYRVFITQQTLDPTRQATPIAIRPDMDNTYIGNPQSLSGLTDVQRYTMAIHWLGAGANLITGSDQTSRDTLGYMLMYDEEATALAAFTATYPMQPRNPTGSPTVGGSDALPIQAWIAGPSPDGTAVVVLANYGSDSYLSKRESACVALGICPTGGSEELVTIPLTALGIGAGMENGADAWDVRRVWGGGGSGGPDHTDVGNWTDTAYCNLGPGESVLYKFTKVGG